MIDFLVEFGPVVGALFVFLVVLAAATFVVTVTISMFRSTRRGPSMLEQLKAASLATRRFLHIFATEWRLYDFVGWIGEKFSRKSVSASKGFSGTLKKGTLILVHRGEFVPIVPVRRLLSRAILDEKTCDYCSELDGHAVTLAPPYGECTNEDGCRCITRRRYSRIGEDDAV